MNQNLIGHINKMCQETFLKWPQVLPLALLWVQAQVRTNLKVSLHEFMFWETVATFPRSKEQTGNQEMEYLISSGKYLN